MQPGRTEQKNLGETTVVPAEDAESSKSEKRPAPESEQVDPDLRAKIARTDDSDLEGK